MFDGEQVSTFAEREMSAQVRSGIQGLLGIPVLRELAIGLRDYAKNRRQDSPAASNTTLAKLETEREELNNKLATAQARLDEVTPNLLSMSQERERITRELDSYGTGSQAQWHPPPADAAQRVLHVHLTSSDRRRTTQRLDEIDDFGASQVLTLLDSIADNEGEASRIKESIARLEGIAPQLDEKRARLRDLNAEIDAANRDIGSLKNEVTGLSAQVESKNKSIANIGAQMDQALPSLRRATRADRMAELIDEIVREAVPSQIEEIANAMTEAHRMMAHKKDLVERVSIDEDCNVQLLNKNGEDIRDMDLSAGEKQIFTQALISAVAEVSGRTFPMLIDTPLGRLDVDHRRGVLKHLTQREGQVILLSTNTEVVGEYFDLIQPHLLKSMIIHHDHSEGVGNSTPRDGYFELGTR